MVNPFEFDVQDIDYKSAMINSESRHVTSVIVDSSGDNVVLRVNLTGGGKAEEPELTPHQIEEIGVLSRNQPGSFKFSENFALKSFSESGQSAAHFAMKRLSELTK